MIFKKYFLDINTVYVNWVFTSFFTSLLLISRLFDILVSIFHAVCYLDFMFVCKSLAIHNKSIYYTRRYSNFLDCYLI